MVDASTSLTRAESRAYDQRLTAAGTPGIKLMETAGQNAAQLLLALLDPNHPQTLVSRGNRAISSIQDRANNPTREPSQTSLQTHQTTGEPEGLASPMRVSVLAGRGNNGGDGFVIARVLAQNGYDVAVWLASPPDLITGDARLAFDRMRVETPSVPVTTWSGDQPFPALVDADVLVDALLGTGARGPLDGSIASMINFANASGKPILAIDLPSGLDCDTGVPIDASSSPADASRKPRPAGTDSRTDIMVSVSGNPNAEPRHAAFGSELVGADKTQEICCIRAHVTVTFVALKRGFLNPASRQFTGTVFIASIVEYALPTTVE